MINRFFFGNMDAFCRCSLQDFVADVLQTNQFLEERLAYVEEETTIGLCGARASIHDAGVWNGTGIACSSMVCGLKWWTGMSLYLLIRCVAKFGSIRFPDSGDRSAEIPSFPVQASELPHEMVMRHN